MAQQGNTWPKRLSAKQEPNAKYTIPHSLEYNALYVRQNIPIREFRQSSSSNYYINLRLRFRLCVRVEQHARHEGRDGVPHLEGLQ